MCVNVSCIPVTLGGLLVLVTYGLLGLPFGCCVCLILWECCD